jgi:4-oxalocrotonate tautomerase
MPIIRVEMFKGRSLDQKRAMAKELTETFIRIAGGKPEGITVIFTDIDKQDWAVAGGLVADRSPG